MPKAFLAIDSDSEALTQAASTYREENIYPALEKSGFQKKLLTGSLCQRQYVEPMAIDPSVAYLTGVGHGTDNSFLGYHNANVFTVGQYNPTAVKGKIVHFLACRAAKTLGPDLVRNGCRAYFGYDEPFTYDPDASAVFFECDGQIDIALANGQTAAEALASSQALFDKRIAELLLTNPHAASYLKFNREHLCGPGMAMRNLGEPTATL